MGVTFSTLFYIILVTLILICVACGCKRNERIVKDENWRIPDYLINKDKNSE